MQMYFWTDLASGLNWDKFGTVDCEDGAQLLMILLDFIHVYDTKDWATDTWKQNKFTLKIQKCLIVRTEWGWTRSVQFFSSVDPWLSSFQLHFRLTGTA